MTNNTEKIQANTIEVLERKNKELLKGGRIILILSIMLLVSLIIIFVYFLNVENTLNDKILETEESYHNLFMTCSYYNSQEINYPILNDFSMEWNLK